MFYPKLNNQNHDEQDDDEGGLNTKPITEAFIPIKPIKINLYIKTNISCIFQRQ